MNLEFLRPALKYIPEVKNPKRHVPFKEKLTWTGVILGLFFIMGVIYPYGVSPEILQERIGGFAQMQIIFASSIGTIISSGIGPIVTSSIILQLMIGSGMIDINLNQPEGKALFQGTQKILTVIVSFFESGALVILTHMVDNWIRTGPETGYWELDWGLRAFTILQIALGSILLMYMDEVVSKWGVGSGIGLFIAGGVSQTIIVASLNPLQKLGGTGFAGIIPNFLSNLANGTFDLVLLFPVIATIIIFLIVVYCESMRLEIPLSYGGIRGVGGRYPLKFFYVSNIPVILAAALLMNVQLWTGMLGVHSLDTPPASASLLQTVIYQIGHYITLNELYGILSPDRIFMLVDLQIIFHLIIHMIVFSSLCVLFGKFWVQTTGLGAEQVAEQIQQGGMQIPGFRRDKRVIERVLNRYIPQITITSSIAVGLLAVGSDLMGAVGSGVGILLTVGILYQMYEQIRREEMAGMSPALRRFMGMK